MVGAMIDADVPVLAVVLAGVVGGAISPALVIIARWFLRSEHRLGGRVFAVAAVATPVAAAIVTAAIGMRPALWAYGVFVCAAVIISIVDVAERRIPNLLVLPASGVVIVLLATSGLLDDEWPQALGAIVGSASLFLLYAALALMSPHGMGMGDVKLAILVGAVTGYLGLSSWLVGMLAGVIIGAIVSLIAVLMNRATRSTLIPFGPSMLAGALVAIALS